METKDLTQYLADYVDTEINENGGVYFPDDDFTGSGRFLVDFINSAIEAFESTNNVKVAIGKGNLLASAPSLLKACKICVTCFDKMATLNLSEMTMRVIKDNAAIVSAIIAKAESEA
jgi:hypothetical protein